MVIHPRKKTKRGAQVTVPGGGEEGKGGGYPIFSFYGQWGSRVKTKTDLRAVKSLCDASVTPLSQMHQEHDSDEYEVHYNLYDTQI